MEVIQFKTVQVKNRNVVDTKNRNQSHEFKNEIIAS